MYNTCPTSPGQLRTILAECNRKSSPIRENFYLLPGCYVPDMNAIIGCRRQKSARGVKSKCVNTQCLIGPGIYVRLPLNVLVIEPPERDMLGEGSVKVK